MKNIRIAVVSPSTPNGSTYVHTGTSWQISKSLDFDTVNNLLVNVTNDTINVTEYRTMLDIKDTDIVYIRTKYHFDDKESDWSRVVSSKGNQTGIQFSNTIVATPVLSVDKLILSTGEAIITINTTEFKMLAGAGSHKSSSWSLYDTNGNVVFERLHDEDNLTQFIYNTKDLDNNKLYEIRVRHHSSTNADSYCARTLFTLKAIETKLYEITQVGDLVTKRDLYFKLISYTSMFESIDLVIQDINGNAVAEHLNQRTLTPHINPGALILYERYNIYSRVKIGVDTYTPYKLIYSGLAYENYLIIPDPYITYLGKYDYTQMLIMGGMSVQNSREFYQGTILLSKNNDRNIYRYKIKNDVLSEIGKCIVLPTDSLLGIPYINILPLYSGDVIINYYDDSSVTETPHSVFRKYKHNVVSNKFTELDSVHRVDEIYSTAIAASACVLRDNSVWYIPAGENNTDGATTNLSLYRLDTDTFNVVKMADLPFNAIKNVSLCATEDDKIIILNGTYIDGYVEGEAGVMKWIRTNDNIYKYDPVLSTFTNIGTMATVSSDISLLQAYLRKDGKIVMFNAGSEGSSSGDQQSFLLDVTTGLVTPEGNDTVDNLTYSSSIALRNGDILRFTNNQEDPQVVHRYVSNTMQESELDENTYITDTISDLVVGLNKTVSIYDPYKYTSITILGSSDEDTGTLIWNDRGVLRTFTYEDLIVYTTMELDKATFDNKRYRSILILDERSLMLTFESVPEII